MSTELLRETVRLLLSEANVRIQHKNYTTGEWNGGRIQWVNPDKLSLNGDGKTAKYRDTYGDEDEDVLLFTDEMWQSRLAKEEYIKNIVALKKPYMLGSWQKVPLAKGQRGSDSGECWSTDDFKYGKIYLSFKSSTSYKKVGSGGRLRDPSGTRYSYRATLGPLPFNTYPVDGAVEVINTVSVGEGREDDKRYQVRKKMSKLFGVDPYGYLGDLEPKNEKPKPDEPATSKPGVVATKPTGEKTMKVYGRLKGAPAHTRLKGKAYLAPNDTKFKSGQSIGVEPKDDKLSVKDPSSDHTQTWELES